MNSVFSTIQIICKLKLVNVAIPTLRGVNEKHFFKKLKYDSFVNSNFGSRKWQNPRYQNLNDFTRQNLMESISTTKDVNNEGAFLEY